MTIFLVKADNLPYFAKGFEHTIITLEPSELSRIEMLITRRINELRGYIKANDESPADIEDYGKHIDFYSALLKKLESV